MGEQRGILNCRIEDGSKELRMLCKNKHSEYNLDVFEWLSNFDNEEITIFVVRHKEIEK